MNSLRERLAALEHEQWVHWTRFFTANSTPENLAKWAKQCDTTYDALSEAEKDKDRAWADQVLAILAELRPCD
jgi:hypothetical protein